MPDPMLRRPLAASLAFGLLSIAALSLAPGRPAAAAGACSDTAQAAFKACLNEIKDDNWIALGTCYNLADPEAENECLDEVSDAARDAQGECSEQRFARLDLCQALNTPAPGGDAPYDPDFSPYNSFPLATPNSFFPIQVGNTWAYADGDGVETIIVEVLDKTKAIAGQTCIVVNDVVREDGKVMEDTDDWYIQDDLGNLLYCGESSRDFVHPDGDDPEEGELVSIEGSWKWDVDGGKPGIIMPATPTIGQVYRQEFALGTAEDAAEVVDDAYVYGFGADPLDLFVPGVAVGLMALCEAGCAVTRDFTPIEPSVEELKFYAPGTGLILEVDTDPEEGGFIMLLGCNVPGSACPALP